MATITKPAETIEVCDTCGRDGYLKECVSCGGMYCLVHEGIIPGCMIEPGVCVGCSDIEEVKAIVAEYAAPMIELRNERREKLRMLQKSK